MTRAKSLDRAASVRAARRALASIFRNAEKVISIVEAHGHDALGEISNGYQKQGVRLMEKMHKLQIEHLKVLSNKPPTACSLYCKPTPPDRGCVHCSLPKSKHTKEAIMRGGY